MDEKTGEADGGIAGACAPSPMEIAQHMGSINPVFRHMGIEILEASAGAIRMALPLRTELSNTFGIAHGGTLFALADMCMGFAANCHNQRAVTASAEVQFLRPGTVGERLVATSREIWRDTRSAIYDVEVIRPDGEIVLLMRGRMRFLGGTLFGPELAAINRDQP